MRHALIGHYEISRMLLGNIALQNYVIIDTIAVRTAFDHNQMCNWYSQHGIREISEL